MPTSRRALLLGAAGVLAAPLLAAAQPAWHAHPVRIVVPFPSGSNDAVAHPLAEKMLARRFGQPFVVDNKPGAGSTIGSAEVARAPADGHMLLVTSSTFATSAAVQRTSYDAARDFECVALLATTPYLSLARPTSRRTR